MIIDGDQMMDGDHMMMLITIWSSWSQSSDDDHSQIAQVKNDFLSFHNGWSKMLSPLLIPHTGTEPNLQHV